MTVPSARTNFRFYKGATFSTEPIIIDDENGDPVNLTGWTGRMRVWREDANPATATPLFDLTSSPAAGLVVGTTNGTVVGTIDASVTALTSVDIDGETWYCRIEMTNTSPTPDTVDRTIEGYIIAFP